ncbi:MAG: sigma-70 region 4 domain-containing protein, partial [Pseudomonadales bacterium]|nr:sigma-70 region 4 domain-containing protein [Pseudomonadales bacterium]
DLSFKEIAEDLRLSEANVRVLLHRARLKLLAVINQYEEGLPC